MIKKIMLTVFIIFWGTAIVMAQHAGKSCSPESPKIFILHSYEENHVCGQPQHDGVVAALGKAGFRQGENLKIDVYHMDTKRKNNTSELIEAQARMALKKIGQSKPDVLVPLDDNAFRTVGLRLSDANIAVVFSGMNGQPEDYNHLKHFLKSREKPGHNITGVYEKLHIADAIRVHFKMFPDLQEVRILTDPSPTGEAINKQIRLELEEGSAIPCNWQIQKIKDWESYTATIHSVNNDSKTGAIYPATLLLRNGKGKTYTAPEIFRWTVRHSKKPEIALNYAFTRLGLFGGAAVDFYAMGYQAGKMVVRILKGEPPGNIPIEDAARYALAFNLKRASQLGIRIPDEIIMAADEVVKD